ncbi:MAG: DNA methyltransferase [Candidatus Firestonebacteria bacterium]
MDKILEEQIFSAVWSFKFMGNWATHDGNYRSNWAPYIPRNVILKFSKENELVLDCFCGVGTTGVECKLANKFAEHLDNFK